METVSFTQRQLLILGCLLLLGYVVFCGVGYMIGRGIGGAMPQAVVVPATPTVGQTPTLTPEQLYAHTMEPALIQLSAWLDGPVAEWDTLMRTKMPTGGMSYGEVLDVYLLGWGERFGYDSPEWKQLQKAGIPAATAIVEGGFEVKSSFGTATPPASVAVAHEQILACVEHKMDLANAIVDYLSRSITPDVDSKSDPCNLLPSAITKVAEFVENSQ